MAERPVFVPSSAGSLLVEEVPISFRWHPGMAPSQKRKNVAELHKEAAARGIAPIIELSSKSTRVIGRKLSAFNQTLMLYGRKVSVESAFQGSKVFENGGPFADLYDVSSRDAKRDERLRNSGRLIGFYFDGEEFPLHPATAFYDWLYINSLYEQRRWLKRLGRVAGYTDIEFNPQRSLNCQARSFATFISLMQRDQLDDAIESFPSFVRLSNPSI